MASPSGWRARGNVVLDPGLVLPHHDGDHAGRRHHVPDVARRADHRARRRQRHLAHHLRRHRRRPAACDRSARWSLAAPGALSTVLILAMHRHGGRRDRRHRVHGAGAAAAPDAVSQAPGRQPHVPGRFLAPAAEAQHVGRHSADLRLVAAAAADHLREFLAGAGAGMAERRSRRCSGTGQPLHILHLCRR